MQWLKRTIQIDAFCSREIKNFFWLTKYMPIFLEEKKTETHVCMCVCVNVCL